MQTQVNLPDATTEQIVERIFASRRITRRDQERLMAILLSKQTLTAREHAQIDRVFDALRSGRVKVVD